MLKYFNQCLNFFGNSAKVIILFSDSTQNVSKSWTYTRINWIFTYSNSIGFWIEQVSNWVFLSSPRDCI